MTIKVLAPSAKDKARLLEQLVKRLLDELGYDEFRSRVTAGGTSSPGNPSSVVCPQPKFPSGGPPWLLPPPCYSGLQRSAPERRSLYP